MSDEERAAWAKRISDIVLVIIVGLIVFTGLVFLLGRHGFN